MTAITIRTTCQRSHEIQMMLRAALQLFVQRGQREGAMRRAAADGESYLGHDLAALGMLFAMPAIRAQIKALPTEQPAARRAEFDPAAAAVITLAMPPREFAWLLEMGHDEMRRDFRERWANAEGGAESTSRAAEKARLDGMQPILDLTSIIADAIEPESGDWELA